MALKVLANAPRRQCINNPRKSKGETDETERSMLNAGGMQWTKRRESVARRHFLDGLCIMAYTRCRGVHMRWFWGWFHSWFYRHVRDRGGGGHRFWTD